MIKNQRAYQLLYHSFKFAPAAYLAAGLAKAVGITAVFALSLFHERVALSDISPDTLCELANQIYKKPASDTLTYAPLPKLSSEIDVSVIIPVYNAEKYLRSCIDSIINQKTGFRMQIIAVDDASTDSSASILKSYKEAVEYVKITDGGSAAKARNAGLLHAEGEYILFVDSDDILLPGAVEHLVKAAQASRADIVQSGWKYVDEDDNFGLSQSYPRCSYTGKRRLSALDLPGMPWGKLYRRELFETIRFPSGYTCFEDAVIHFLVFQAAKNIISTDKMVYAWRKNPTGLTATSQNRSRAMQAYWIVEEMLTQHEKLKLANDEMFYRNLIMQLSNYCYACVSGFDERSKMIVFMMCANLYQSYPHLFSQSSLPYAIRLAHRALCEKDYKLWCIQGKLFSLII